MQSMPFCRRLWSQVDKHRRPLADDGKEENGQTSNVKIKRQTASTHTHTHTDTHWQIGFYSMLALDVHHSSDDNMLG